MSFAVSLEDHRFRPPGVDRQGGLHAPAPLALRKAPPGRQGRLALFSGALPDERLQSLHEACDVLADGFSDLDEQICAYLQAEPRAASLDGPGDVDRFLNWLAARADLNDAQRDYVTCQQSRHAVERVALRQRLAHLRFQELHASTGDVLPRLAGKNALVVHLNPIHVWATFETRTLLDDDAPIPATVVFFPAAGGIRTVVVEEDAAELLMRLEQQGPLRVRDLLRPLDHDERIELQELLGSLTEMGLLALA